MPCSVGARVGFQPAHREREQQHDDHQQGEEDAPARGTDIFCVLPALSISQRA